jgi:RNA polymerase sigma-70 factor, ECF subfamily
MDNAQGVDAEELLTHLDWLNALARQLVADHERAKDLVQDACVVALRSHPSRASGIRGWLAQVLRNLHRQQTRAQGHARSREWSYARLDESVATDQIAERVALQRELARLVLELEEPGRTVTLLRYYSGLSPKDIASRLGVSVPVVNGRLQRALARLRRRLGSEANWNLSALGALVLERPVGALRGLPDSLTLGALTVATGSAASSAIKLGIGAALVVALGVSTWMVLPAAPDRPNQTAPSASVEVRSPSDRSLPSSPESERVALHVPTEPATTVPSSDALALPKALIRGRVANAANDPIPGAEVLVGYRPAADFNVLDLAYSDQDITVGSAQTGPDGSFTIEVPPDWPLRVRAHAPGYSNTSFDDVFAGADLSFILETGTSVIGQVTRKLDGSPVAGVHVGIFRRGYPDSVETTTASDGRYALLDARPGESVIIIDSDWLADPPWTELVAPRGAQIIHDFALEEGVTLFGTVSDERTGTPISDAEIGVGWTYHKPVRTKVDGTYELRGFGGPGIYEVYVRAEGYIDAKKDFGPKTMPSERTKVDFALALGYSMVGRIVDPGGRPIPRAYVAAVSDGGPDGIESWKSARSLEDGKFEIRSLSPQHQYGLFVRASGWANVAYTLVPFSGVSPMDLRDVQMQPAGSISGIVTDESGQARSDVKVGLYGNNSDAGRLSQAEHAVVPRNLSERSVQSDPSGRFHFGEVAAGEYTLRALHRSGHYSEPIQINIDSGEQVAGIQLEMPSGLRLSGKAVSPQGDGLHGARVRLVWGGDQARDRTAFSGAAGTFQFLGLEQHPYTLIIQGNASGNGLDQSMVVVPRVTPGQEELRVVVPPASHLRGIVQTPDGQPSPHAHVEVLIGSTFLSSDFCDEKGTFELAVPEGVLLEVSASTTSPSSDPRYPFRVNHEGLRATASSVAAGQDIVLRLQAP